MIYQIIQEIKSTRSRNEKEAIILREVNNVDLKNFFRLSLNPFINFYQKKKFEVSNLKSSISGFSDTMIYLEETISKRVITGNTAIESINKLLADISKEDGKCVLHILKKESGCEVGSATINKIWPNLIPSYPCLLATAYDEKLAEKLNWKVGVYSQLKSDGLRINLIVDESGSVTAYSRAGNELNFFGAFDFIGEMCKSVVIDGELLTVNSDGKFHSRQVSNGTCSKAIKGTMSIEESSTLHITAWDIIPLDDFKNLSSQLEYKDRFSLLKLVLDKLENRNKISLIPSRIVHSIAQALEHNDEVRLAGEEGTMNKDQNMLWSDTRSKKQLKLKAENTGDFEVVGYKDGEGKLTGNLGSLVIASSDRNVVANMSGFTFKLRSEIWANIINCDVEYKMVINDVDTVMVAKPGDSDIKIGSIIECMYNCKIKSRDSEVYSIFLPRYKTTRIDKQTANTFEELK
jgi:DNA ligase-1